MTLVAVPLAVNRRRGIGVRRGGKWALYFGALGLGYILVEIVLIQRLNLFLGYPAYALSVAAGHPVSTNSALTMADGLACRTPDARAVETIRRGADRVVTVSDAEIEAAIRVLFTDTHNLAEGAGAAATAALLKERHAIAGRRAAAILTGGNIDRPLYYRILGDEH